MEKEEDTSVRVRILDSPYCRGSRRLSTFLNILISLFRQEIEMHSLRVSVPAATTNEIVRYARCLRSRRTDCE